MDYLRTLGSAAVSTLVQKSGLNLPFYLGPKITIIDEICSLYDGTKRDDGSLVSVFEYDFSHQTRKHIHPMATNALRKLRTTRHPDVVKFIDAVETDSNIYIMTERVRPLQAVLQAWTSRDAKEREDWLLWGLHRISVALAFINDPCVSTHGKLCVNSIFISPSGEWKLGSFELFSSPREDSANLYMLGGLYPGSTSWAPPEVKKGGWATLREFDAAVPDAYALGLLLHALFNPTQPLPTTANPPHSPPSSSSRGAIPATVFPSFRNLLNPNPKGRLTAKAFLAAGMVETGFFATNRLVQVCLGLDNFTLASEAEKNILLRSLKESAPSFPSEFTSNRVLPSLISALEFGGASAATVLPLVLQYGTNVSPDEYPNIVLTPVVKLFGSPDRGTRMALLDHLSEYADRLDKTTVSEKIFPHLSTGFTDTVTVIREATIKSIILLAPKLSDRILNNELLRYLARMQTDPEASIRTNTCVLIGRLGPTLGYNTKRKVLAPAFSRALKDPFVHARVAGLMGFMATADCFEVEDIANKVIPSVAFAMIDKEKLVRDQASKAVELFIKKLESHATKMPETTLPDSTDVSGTPFEQMALTNSTAGTLAGWAISSLGKKLIPSDFQTSIGVGIRSAPSVDRSTSAPTLAGTVSSESYAGNSRLSPMLSTPESMPIATSSMSSPAPSRTKGMQLGAGKVLATVTSATLAQEWTEEATSLGRNSNPWGSDDLIDIDADQGDWSAFESAPPVVLEPKPIRPVHPAFPRTGNINRTSPALVTKPNGYSNLPSDNVTLISSLPKGGDDAEIVWDVNLKTPSPTPAGGLSREEKAAQMARRKEERKQRIALLKEQKKNVART